jgi:hypothetical protein
LNVVFSCFRPAPRGAKIRHCSNQPPYNIDWANFHHRLLIHIWKPLHLLAPFLFDALSSRSA